MKLKIKKINFICGFMIMLYIIHVELLIVGL